MTKEPNYKLLKRQDHFELRQYQAFTMIEASDRNLQSYQGFRLAFNFIQGDNDRNQKIAMTAPVINRLNDDGIQTTSFVMPPQMEHEEIPQPINQNLHKIFVPDRIIAVYRFRFNPKMESIRNFESDLVSWIKQQGYTIVGDLQLARYNPPFIPGFLKRNELWFEVTKD